MSSDSMDTELLTEHFGYPPVSLLDDIINSVNILAERALNSVEQALLRQPPASLGFKPAAYQNKRDASGGGGKSHEKLSQAALEAAAEAAHRHEVENGTHQLETLLCASIDRNFDKFELYAMRNLLCVKPEDRDWIRLTHYEGLDFEPFVNGDQGDGGGGGGPDGDDASIAHLHRRLQASLKLGHLLDVETRRNEAMLARLRALTGSSSSSSSGGGGIKAEQPPQDDATSLAFLLDRGPLTESDAAAPLTTTTAFALSQLPALRHLSRELREKAPGLAAAAALDDDGDGDGDGDDNSGGRSRTGDGKSWRWERLEYVEGSTRKHLERVRGLNLGRNGEVRSEADGAPQADDGSSSGNNNGSNSNIAVEPEALTNILNILRESHGTKAAAAQDTAQPDDQAMDES